MNVYSPHPALSRALLARELCALVQDFKGEMPSPDGCIVEEKKDGWRCLFIHGELVSREGCSIVGADHIADQLRELERKLGRPTFFDGELVVGDSFEATQAHLRSRGRHGDGGTLHLFDTLDMDVWHGSAPSQPLTARRAQLDALAGELAGEAVRILPWRYFETAADIEADAADVIASGGEGIVIKDPRAVYTRRRNNAWLRIKGR